MSYSINLFGSHPDLNNDDCWTGVDVDTRAEAERIFNAADPIAEIAKLPGVHANFASYHRQDTTHIMLDGPDTNQVREIRKARKSRPDQEWAREHAMQMGMGLGVEAYNDAR